MAHSKANSSHGKVRYSMRMIFSVLLGFFTGYSGSGAMAPKMARLVMKSMDALGDSWEFHGNVWCDSQGFDSTLKNQGFDL